MNRLSKMPDYIRAQPIKCFKILPEFYFLMYVRDLKPEKNKLIKRTAKFLTRVFGLACFSFSLSGCISSKTILLGRFDIYDHGLSSTSKFSDSILFSHVVFARNRKMKR